MDLYRLQVGREERERTYPDESLRRRHFLSMDKTASNIPIYIQQDATLHSLLYLQTAVHVSGGTSTHHQERKQLYPQML